MRDLLDPLRAGSLILLAAAVIYMLGNRQSLIVAGSGIVLVVAGTIRDLKPPGDVG